MSEALNVTKAAFGGLREVTTSPLWQYDYGQILKITGLDLPQAFEVHFSNSRKSGETITQIGTDSQVTIPDMYLTSGADIYAFIFLHDGTDDGETEYVIKIPVRERPEPSDIEPTPEQQDFITEAIAALNTAVAQCGAYVEHYPTVIDGEWYVWDEASEQFVSTGVAATGNGIESARLNQDYTLTLVFTDGTSFTTPISIRGAQGEKGDTGAVPNFSIGTVTTLPAGSAASASITGTQNQPVLNLSIPQGQDGAITNLDTTLTVAGKAADAKAVGDAVNDLKSELNPIKNTIINEENLPIPLSWTAGNLNTSTGIEESGTRQRSDYISLKQDSFDISFSSPITECMVFWYDENKQYKKRTGWLSSGTTVANANVYFRIMARKSGSSQLTADEIKSFTAVTAPIWKGEIEEVNTRVDSFEPLLSAFTIDDQIFTIDGYYINIEGNLRKYSSTSSIHYWATDFIDVSFCKQVKVHTCLGTGSTIAVYNGAKQLTRVITTQGSSALYDYDITLQNGEKYIRSSFQELTGYTTKDQFYLIAYKNVLLAFESISENGGESNNAVERAQLKPLSMPTVVFVDDDGSSSLWDTTVPIFETAGIPLTIAVGKDSDIMSDLSTLRTWLSTAGHDMVQHSLGSDQDLSAKTYTELISWIESEQAFFYNNGFVVSNIVYGGSQWSEQMLRVIERYYNSGCTIPNSQMGISYGYNLPGTSRYKLARYAVSNWTSTSGHSLQNCKDIFDEFLATGQNGIIIFYSHSYQLVDNPDRVQILTDFIDYVKTAQTNGDCAITTLSAVFG